MRARDGDAKLLRLSGALLLCRGADCPASGSDDLVRPRRTCSRPAEREVEESAQRERARERSEENPGDERHSIMLEPGNGSRGLQAERHQRSGKHDGCRREEAEPGLGGCG